MIDETTIKVIEAALANGKRVEVAVEYADREHKAQPYIVVVETGRKVLCKRRIAEK